jgi:hypothetical protein
MLESNQINSIKPNDGDFRGLHNPFRKFLTDFL